MALLGLVLSIYVLTLIVSMIGGFFRFLADIRKWKSKEEKVHITKKQFEKDIQETETPGTDQEEKEESEVLDDDGLCSEQHSPIVF